MNDLYVLAVDIDLASCSKIESFFGKKITPLEIAKELNVSINDIELYPIKYWISLYNLEEINSYKWITIIEKVW